jgi:cytochrome c-type biogenesis protein CcsB
MKIFKFLFSGLLMGNLLIIFAVAIGYATFIENDYDATTAKLIVYNARWFEILMLLMVVNFTGMIFTRKLYQKEQLNILIIHLALIIIIIGAGLTRYIGFEGMMHIRNGQTSNTFNSSDTYLSINTGGEVIREKVLLSGKSKNFYNKTFEIGDENVDFTVMSYFPNAVESIIPSSTGSPFVHLVVGGSDGRHDIYLREGESQNVHGLGFSFGDTTRLNYVQIVRSIEGLLVRLPIHRHQGDTQGPSFSKFVPLQAMSTYRVSEMSFLLNQYFESAEKKYFPSENEDQHGTRIINVRVNGIETALQFGVPKLIDTGKSKLSIGLGILPLELPFSLKLEKFQLERYPGSNSPSSFASNIILIDQNENIERPYKIFMNNILSYKGYRFYQSSYDRDEKGTVLSVNHDYWGTLVTYIGYFLLFASLIVSFFTKKTRFSRLLHQFEIIRTHRQKLMIGLLMILFSLAGVQNAEAQAQYIDKEHAASFGRLQVQNQQGRVMPVNTMASEVLVKIYKKNTYEGLSADQVFMEMVLGQGDWRNMPIIKVANEEVAKIIGIQGDYGRFTDFITTQGQYKLKARVDEAYIKKPALRSKLDKEIINIDERVNVCYMALNGSLLKIFPLPNHPNNKWGTPLEFETANNTSKNDSLFISYITHLVNARSTNNYDNANAALGKIANYQRVEGKAITMSDTKVGMEIFYNKTNIFKRLFPIYLILGIVLTGFFFIQIFKPGMQFTKITKVFSGILLLAFLVQTFGLIIRWYISGHAPWSNGYESMIYISWVTVLAGLIFMKKSPITLALTALLAGITLLTAHMSWMNPEITNLVPVLKSYWLTIHVATITASYGFLGLGAMLGFLNLCIMIFKNKKNQERVNLILEELSITIEMSLIIGLVLLIIGNFLGGIWANESWGRYWGWDPKETWTLVTIIVYSFILHMGMIPRLKSHFSFNFLSLIGFGTVLMTYFGVNYFLSGLHSYAGGDPIPVPTFVYYTIFVIFLISLMAGINDYKLNLSNKIKEELAQNGTANP